MKLRTLVIAVLVLLGLSAAVYVANRPAPPPPADPRVGKPVLDSDTANRAAAIVVADQGKKVELARGPDGAWVDRSYFDLPADFDKVARFVQDLHEAKVDRFVTENPERIARLEFKDAYVGLSDAAGKDIWSLTLGKNSETGGGRFIRFGTEPRAFYSSLSVWLDTDPKSWADAQLVAVKADDVARMEIGFAGVPAVVVSRPKKDAPWAAASVPAGKKLVPDKVASLLSSLTSLRFSDTTDPKDPAASAAAAHPRRFVLATFDGRTVTVTLARTPEEKKLKPPTPDAQAPVVPTPKPGESKAEVKPITPEYETIPAGPVFATVASSDPRAAVNASMARRAFKVDDYAYTGLPQKPEELFEDAKAK